MRNECYVAVGFDGTCVSHAYPKMGDDVGADLWLRSAVALGAKLILWTLREDIQLGEAVNWFEAHQVKLWAVNRNPNQEEWSKSPKIHAHILIDDGAIGVPLCEHGGRKRMVVDWEIAGPLLLKRCAGVLNQ